MRIPLSRDCAVSRAVRTMVAASLCDARRWGGPRVQDPRHGGGRGVNSGPNSYAGKSHAPPFFKPSGSLDLDFLSKYLGRN